MQTIGLTGGIASGKSTVSRMIRDKGVCVIDADAIGRRLSEPGGSLYRAFAERFPSSFFHADGTMDRRKIGGLVFAHPEEKAWIDHVSHPLIQAEAEREARVAKDGGAAVVVYDVPLLFEAGWDARVDETWLVYVSPAVQLMRLMARDGYSEEEARARIAAQMALDEKRALADVILDNSGTMEDLAAQVNMAWKERVDERVS